MNLSVTFLVVVVVVDVVPDADSLQEKKIAEYDAQVEAANAAKAERYACLVFSKICLRNLRDPVYVGTFLHSCWYNCIISHVRLCSQGFSGVVFFCSR